MSYEPLHHKYRPQTFADLVGQEAIATTLTNAIVSQRIAPAYLFAGPRGTGKTSSARILTKSLNCLSSERPTPTPCGKCEVCRAIARGSALDAIEIDAASNTGVDNIRDLIERAQFAPVQCRYKVYAIDECHMLSTAAFNALLKTLEEPPERVIFILATTDPQRVLPTIISRCQRFDFRRIPLESMVAHLKYIASQENIEINDEAIILVAQIANGGLRDAQSLLDQLSLLSGKITPDRVWDLVGSVAERDLLKLLRAIASDKAEAVLEQCRHLMNRGREPLVILQNLANFYLNLLIAKTAPNRPDMVAVTSSTWQQLCQEAQRWELNAILRGQQHLKDSEAQLKNTTQPRLWLEVTLLGLLPSAYHPGGAVVGQPPTSSEIALSRRATQLQPSASNSMATTPSMPPQEKPRSQLPTPAPQAIDSPAAPVPVADSISQTQIWQALLERLQIFTQALLRSHCHLISLDENVAWIGVKNERLLGLARDKLTEIEAAFQAVCHHRVKVHFQVAVPTAPESHSEELSNSDAGMERKENGENRHSSSSTANESSKIIESQPISQPTAAQPEKISQQQSLSSVRSEQSINNNGRKETRPGSLGISPSLAIKNGSTSEFSCEDELQKAAESLAKCFEGEIVHLDRPINDEFPTTNEKAADLRVSQPLQETKPDLEESPPTPQRLDLSNFTDEDDIPF
ncbi:DNA polymerase III, subunit gamma/tau [Pleurocapsa sp. PCC 7327]|uniref:DNA polymerase III subunit gamma/tau n=1 Tax=Pleurocapsa sp. PCC 7327 TaxID=118163 RepID=UPI00029FD0F0|nr:DNA polymerase III subunit gamma/tau [Pleurocapsa sp. PCC 7327]AFY79228.1 DNA polymerase III, subunit gamma/tau [Pleurocapsa sp. PCC 7327]